MEKITYEMATKELSQIISKLESGTLTIDEALTLFERGKQLLSICHKTLNEAKGKLTEIKESIDGLEEL